MLEFRQVSACYGNTPVLREISFSLRPHRITVLVGRNGCGKSTLLSCVNQQVPYTGQILEGEKDFAILPSRERARTLAILPQILPAPHITAREMVAFGRNPYMDFTGRLTPKDREIVERAMVDARVSHFSERYMDTLSGGERQRVQLAMILAQNTPIALLDEPTSHMDQAYEAEFLELLRTLKIRRKKTFLIILHDLTLAAEFADDIVVMEGGQIRFSGTKEECLRQEVFENTFSLHRYNVFDGIREKVFFCAT